MYGRTSTAPVADNILPCVLEVREETEEAWNHAVTMDVDPSTLTFKHAPAYCLYLLARYRASTSYRPDVTPMERANRLSSTFAKVANILYAMIQVSAHPNHEFVRYCIYILFFEYTQYYTVEIQWWETLFFPRENKTI